MQRFARFALVLVVLGFAALPSPARPEPLRLAYTTWAAWGPFFIAREKGWFAEEGVDVEFVRMEDASVRVAALAAGTVDATSLTLDAVPLFLRPGAPLKFAFALASSRGGDAILAAPDIETIADLKGRSVAVEAGGTSQFFVSMLLRDAGLTEQDVTVVDLNPSEAGSAFVAGKVDAAVTWEPWITRGIEGKKGHLLADTTQHPGLITDMLVVRADRLEARRDAFKALYRAWNRAVAFATLNREEATEIMAEGVGGWLSHPDVFADTWAGMAYFDAPSNELFFGRRGQPGLLAETTGRALEIWGGSGKLRVRVAPTDLVSRTIVGN